MDKPIARAIKGRYTLALTYGGFSRTVEPYAYGELTTGREGLNCYQTSGGSQSDEPVGWKLFFVDDLRAIAITGQQFSRRSDYVRDARMFKRIYAQV
jgi:hypothetical protein